MAWLRLVETMGFVSGPDQSVSCEQRHEQPADPVIRRLVQAVRGCPIEVSTQVERPGWSVATHRGSASWVHGGYTGGRRPVRLAGREPDDHVVLCPHVDPTHVELWE
jgi:hypothetical protein